MPSKPHKFGLSKIGVAFGRRGRHSGGHAARQAEQREEVQATVEARGDRHVVLVDHHRDRLPLLAHEKKQGLVELAEAFAHVDHGDARGQALVALRGPARLVLDGDQLGRGTIDRLPQAGVGQARGQVAHDQPEQSGVVVARAQGAIEALGDGARLADARVDRPRVRVTPRIGLDALAHPLGGAGQAVEVGVTHDGLDGADARDQRRVDHLGAGAVLGLLREHEARIGGEARVLVVVVVIDPGPQPVAQRLDERQGDLLEPRAQAGEGHVDHHDPAGKLLSFRQLARRGEGEGGRWHRSLASAVQLPT